MKKSLILTILLFTGLVSTQVLGLDLEEVNLLDVSTSGRSLVLDRGLLEKFEEGIFAKFYLQKGPKEFPKIFLVAEGELVKSFPKKSYWLLKKVHIPESLKRDFKILILTSEKINSGRGLKIKNRHVVMADEHGGDVDDYLDKNQTNVPARLIKEEVAYEPTADIFEKDIQDDFPAETDVLLTTYESYKKQGGNYYSEEYGDLTGQKYFIGNTQAVLGDIKRAEDKKLFDSISTNYVKKTNNIKYGLKSFYSEQEKLKELPELNIKGSVASTFDVMKEEKKEAQTISPRATAKYKRDGDQWSSDLDDVALRRYFIRTGLEKEARRRELALNELDGHEIVLHYSGALNSHSNTEDPNYQGRGFNFGISYDLHLSRTSDQLRDWSIQFLYENGVTEYNTGVFNARSEEVSYGAYLNYYFVNNPLTLNSFIYLAGIGLKNGSASVFTPDFTKEYSYQVFTLPALQLMTKYRFRSGDLTEDNIKIGASANFGINIDFKNLSVIDRVEDDINSKISVIDLKYTLGMSVYF